MNYKSTLTEYYCDEGDNGFCETKYWTSLSDANTSALDQLKHAVDRAAAKEMKDNNKVVSVTPTEIDRSVDGCTSARTDVKFEDGEVLMISACVNKVEIS